MNNSYQAYVGLSDSEVISKEEIAHLFEVREAKLLSLEHLLSPKFFQTIQGRIAEEKKAFADLLHTTEEKKEELSHYSFVLHPYYFEQHFLGEDE